MTDRDAAQEAQRERALQAWELVVDEPAEERVLEILRRVLRVKRFDLAALAARLPGCVRRGARVDLEDYHEKLVEAGVRCSLRRREPGPIAGPGEGT